ncbi:MAG: DUF502 domain-containing protein [Arcobacter butzleri]|jgi:uncharacterized membrane protein|nr:DUF502 domain-containing protein [Arcobacteraceae bacterium]MDY0365685.1 DUF502 domain-containing protein [Arcobacteraceae bacterium]NLO17960.1 DUF502 domain-containing protein [Aliarcobacter butzleri]
MMQSLGRFLLIGTLSIVPLFIVIQVVFWVQNLSFSFFDFLSKYTNSSLYSALIIIFALLFLITLGYFMEKTGRFFILSWIEYAIEKIPAVKTIYSISKKITDMFIQNKDGARKEVVLVEYPKDNLWCPAYVLNEHGGTLVLFVPTSPNPTSGYTVIVQRKFVISTSLTLEEASKFIISMGADYIKKEEISNKINSHKSWEV